MAQMDIGQRACDSWKASVASPFHLRNFPYSLVLLRIASARSWGQFPVAPRFLRVLGAECCSIIFASRGVDTPQIAARTDDGLLGSNCCKQALARFDSLMSDIAIFHQLTSAFSVCRLFAQNLANVFVAVAGRDGPPSCTFPLFLLACFGIPSEKSGHNQHVRSLGSASNLLNRLR
jgi:hypothetical protein